MIKYMKEKKIKAAVCLATHKSLNTELAWPLMGLSASLPPLPSGDPEMIN
jgi:hypothetical protein